MDAATYRIAPGYSSKDWKRLRLDEEKPDSADWQRAVEMFRNRINGRFFAPVDTLVGLQEGCNQTFGFAILALDCLVIETIQGFRRGIVNHSGRSKELFVEFLTGWSLFKVALPRGADALALAKLVYTDCRCALLHSGATGGGLLVGISGNAFAFGRAGSLRINRTALHNGLKEEFEVYLAGLLDVNAVVARQNFKKKMNALCGVD
ncbi:hypothetical protein [Hyphomicrobium sp. CS1BSMeth3]|uniref:hypothetical protein n=1 Tax=Hyphomicrobium sp. CS1BSMeth3 TaxID=1892844 RepID=UPI000931A254|nr:hypothetical protein [Hyphomicrobium sp. CS1BSMeth3]